MSLALIVIFWLMWGLAAFTYVVFPVSLWLAAKTRRAAAEPALLDDADLPTVVMVVAAHNEERHIAAKLANSWALDYPQSKFTLTIGSDGSSDGTNHLLASCTRPNFRARLFTQRRGKPSVLNDLVAEVDADIIVMSDANTRYAPDALRRLVRHFRDANVGCVSGELKLGQNGGVSGEGLYWKYEGWIKRCESRLGFLMGCNGGIYAMRRSLYQPLPAGTIVDDYVQSLSVLRGGKQVKFDPTAVAVEPPCESARDEMVRKSRIGAGAFQSIGLTADLLHPRHGLKAYAFLGHKVMRWFVPWYLLIGFVANMLLVTHPFYQALMLLQMSGVFTAWLAYRNLLPRFAPRLARPVSYFYLMNYALFCGFWRFVCRTQKVTWERAATVVQPANA
ncbi:MAG: glycosyltransferase family 2 protein [Armatimonadetes bacterium]|nr:glycosyltransferase family 2 protein [Armatimonadota bacterium]MDE2205686.1 glycosyltransferase family 2 protein [Armatimonadota bacterium]